MYREWRVLGIPTFPKKRSRGDINRKIKKKKKKSHQAQALNRNINRTWTQDDRLPISPGSNSTRSSLSACRRFVKINCFSFGGPEFCFISAQRRRKWKKNENGGKKRRKRKKKKLTQTNGLNNDQKNRI
jgi:hypothetical protein